MVFKGNVNREDYIDFINYVFSFNGHDRSFEKLLPKLYKKEKNGSVDDTFFIMGENRLAAAIGCFPIEFSILGEKLPVKGIGNVAVHPRDRSKGYMKACMKAALDEMIADGVAFSVLGGRRHRYNHFGYEKCGANRTYEVNGTSLAYVSADGEPSLTMRKLDRNDTATLKELKALSESRPYHCTRPMDDLYDTLISWHATPYVFFEGDTFAGWAVIQGGDVYEFIPAKLTYVAPMLRLLTKVRWGLNYRIPNFDKDIANAIFPYAESSYAGWDAAFNVLDYEKVLRQLLKLRSTYEPLLDGEVVVEIDGYAGVERLKLTVCDNIPTVCKTDDEPAVKLSHLSAMRAFFLEDSPDRNVFSPVVRSWLPLPIYIFNADNV